jgi:uncharacterized repeat protein (TIGR03803 family)
MKPESISASGKLMLALALVLGPLGATPWTQAQTFSVVHNFTGGSDGGDSMNGFVVTGKILYGTATSGGAFNNGVVFKLNTTTDVETVLHSFAGGTDGANPQGSLLWEKGGHIYGTTTAGGASGLGTVFEVTGEKETVLYSFAGGKDGADPTAGLILDATGNLYGTTSQGGSSSNGTVFELAAPKTKGGNWTESVLYSFGKGKDGSAPVGGVNFDATGNLYGTTSAGGAHGYGTVFQLVPGTVWTENILYSFENADDGAVPYAGLISDKAGNFYGAATEGGTGGGGTAFKLTLANGKWTFDVLYSVPGWGISGSYRNVVLDSSGNLYATTHCDGNYSAGTVYELTPSGGTWTNTVLYNFTGDADGLYSFSNLVLSDGKLYGTTKYGGASGNGVIFEVTP